MTTVKACPKCGLRMRNHCHHDGDDIPSVEMTTKRCTQLIEASIEDIEQELEMFAEEHAAVQNIDAGDNP